MGYAIEGFSCFHESGGTEGNCLAANLYSDTLMGIHQEYPGSSFLKEKRSSVLLPAPRNNIAAHSFITEQNPRNEAINVSSCWFCVF
jgi:hypothetical protein